MRKITGNNLVLWFFLVFFSLALVSCAKKEPKVFFIKENEASHAKDMSFSIEIHSDVGHLTMIDKEDLVVMIQENLRKTKKYKNIFYSSLEKQAEQHLHFQLVVTRTRDTDQPVVSAISRLTLLTIPRAIQYFTDFSVFLYKNKQEINSSTVYDKFDSIIWLPLIVLNPVVNDFFIAKLVLDSQLPTLLEAVITY